MQVLGLRPYKKEDADTILSWSKDEKAFYQWSGKISYYPGGIQVCGFPDGFYGI